MASSPSDDSSSAANALPTVENSTFTPCPRELDDQPFDESVEGDNGIEQPNNWQLADQNEFELQENNVDTVNYYTEESDSEKHHETKLTLQDVYQTNCNINDDNALKLQLSDWIKTEQNGYEFQESDDSCTENLDEGATERNINVRPSNFLFDIYDEDDKNEEQNKRSLLEQSIISLQKNYAVNCSKGETEKDNHQGTPLSLEDVDKLSFDVDENTMTEEKNNRKIPKQATYALQQCKLVDVDKEGFNYVYLKLPYSLMVIINIDGKYLYEDDEGDVSVESNTEDKAVESNDLKEPEQNGCKFKECDGVGIIDCDSGDIDIYLHGETNMDQKHLDIDDIDEECISVKPDEEDSSIEANELKTSASNTYESDLTEQLTENIEVEENSTKDQYQFSSDICKEENEMIITVPNITKNIFLNVKMPTKRSCNVLCHCLCTVVFVLLCLLFLNVSTTLKQSPSLQKGGHVKSINFPCNCTFPNNLTVFALGFRRPTFVPPRPLDEPDLPPPDLIRDGNAATGMTGHTYPSPTTRNQEQIENESSLTEHGVQEPTMCTLNSRNFTSQSNRRNDSTDYVSLRNYRQLYPTRGERECSSEPLMNIGNRSSQSEPAGISFTAVQYQEKQHELSDTSFLTCATNNNERQEDPKCYDFDGTESTALPTSNGICNEVSQQRGGEIADEFGHMLLNVHGEIPVGLSDRDARAQTFRYLGWQHEYLSPEEMADAGLFYTGTGNKTVCFYCKNCICDWKEGDVPFSEHKRLFPDCNYVRRHSTNTHQPQMFPQRELNRRSELENESLSGLESIETSCDTQAQNVLQPFPNDTGGSSAQQPKLKCDNLLAVSKKRNDSKLMNDRNDDGKMCDQYEDTRAVLPTRSSDNNRIRRTRRYSGSDAQNHSRNNAYCSVSRQVNSASDPALHNRVTTDESLYGLESIGSSSDTQAQNVLQPFPNGTGGSSAQQPKLKCDNLPAVSKKRTDSKLMNDRNDDGKMCAQDEDTRAVLPTRSSDNNRIRRTRRYSGLNTQRHSRNNAYCSVTRETNSASGPALHNRVTTDIQAHYDDSQDASNLSEAYPTNLYQPDLYDVSIRQTGESTYDRATYRLPLLTLSNNPLSSLSTGNVERNSHQTTRHADRIRQRIEEILDSNPGRMVLDEGYRRSDVARAIEITLRARTTEREVGNIYEAIMIVLSVLRARGRRRR